VQSQDPPLDLTLRPGFPAPEGNLLPTGSLRLTTAGQVSGLPGYVEGGWWVQDAAAALAAQLLAPTPGEAVLDTALDISGPRIARVAANLARTGLSAQIVVTDALAWEPEARFDAILLDAPCSATGTIRRHPDLPFIKDGSELPGLVTLQATLLDRALGWLKPGGRLVYVTCSLLPDEGEAQLTAALTRHPGLQVETLDIVGVDPGWWTKGGGLRLRPDYWAESGGMDGFFMVRLRLPE
jgi:16S rRNA (cytosine967-C5)-methyltransferase